MPACKKLDAMVVWKKSVCVCVDSTDEKSGLPPS